MSNSFNQMFEQRQKEVAEEGQKIEERRTLLPSGVYQAVVQKLETPFQEGSSCFGKSEKMLKNARMQIAEKGDKAYWGRDGRADADNFEDAASTWAMLKLELEIHSEDLVDVFGSDTIKRNVAIMLQLDWTLNESDNLLYPSVASTGNTELGQLLTAVGQETDPDEVEDMFGETILVKVTHVKDRRNPEEMTEKFAAFGVYEADE